MASLESFPAPLGSDSNIINGDSKVVRMLRLNLVWHPYKFGATVL